MKHEKSTTLWKYHNSTGNINSDYDDEEEKDDNDNNEYYFPSYYF